MPWGRLDDTLYDHPKLDLIPVEDRLAAIGLWARAISWCNRFLTDGLVPRDRIAKLDGTLDLADRLVVAGLFETASDVPTGHFRVHDFLAFNDSREKVLERRANDAKRKAEWRAAREAEKAEKARHAGTPRTKRARVPSSVPASVPPESHAESQRDSRTHESRPDPTRPNESRETPQPPAASGGRRTTRRDRTGPMRTSTRYPVITDDTPDEELPDWLRQASAGSGG